MEVIGARAGNNVDDPARGIAIFRGEVAFLEIKLLHGIGVRERHVHVQIGVVMAGAIQLVIYLSHARAIDARGLLSRIDSAMTADPAAVTPKVHAAGGQKDQRLSHAAIQRQLHHALLIDELAHGTGARYHQLGIGLHRDLLGHLPELHGHGLVDCLVHGQSDARLHVSRKSRAFHTQLIVAHGKPGEKKRARRIRRRGLGEPGIHIAHGHARVRQDGVARIDDGTTEAGGGVLRLNRRNKQKQGCDRNQVPFQNLHG